MNCRWKIFLALPLLLSAACGTITNLPQSAPPKHADYHAPAHSAASATVTLSSSPENITINPVNGENYLDAVTDYIGTMTFDANGANDSYIVKLTEDANNLNYSGTPLKWDIDIDPAAPLALTVDSSSGDLTLNLNDFTLTRLDAQSSSGQIEAHLPAAQKYAAAFETSSGGVNVSLEDQSEVDLTKFKSSSGAITLNTGSASTVSADVETSSGAITLNFGADTSVAMVVGTSSGSVTVSVPSGTALRLQIDDNSSGSVTVPAWLARVSGAERTGVWESAGFAQAERQIVVHVTRDSSGAITVTEAG